MKSGKADAMTLSQKIDYFYSDSRLKSNFGNNMNNIRQWVKAMFVTNNGNYLFICQVYLDC